MEKIVTIRHILDVNPLYLLIENVEKLIYFEWARINDVYNNNYTLFI